jgi:hypothetical protein
MGPLLALSPTDPQNQFRIEVGGRSFGHLDADLRHHFRKSPATIIDLLAKDKDAQQFLRNLIAEVIKASN